MNDTDLTDVALDDRLRQVQQRLAAHRSRIEHRLGDRRTDAKPTSRTTHHVFDRVRAWRWTR